jgi:hypothetical protein
MSETRALALRPGRYSGHSVWVAFALAAWALAAGGAEVPVAGFESGIGGWLTNDGGKASGAAPEAALVSVAAADAAHTGAKCLQVSFHPGKGWANAFLPVADAGERWAALGVDELALWLKGDGSDKQVDICIQAWGDDLRPAFFNIPVSLRDAAWRQVVLPLSAFQASNPEHPLRLRALISLQVNGAGELGPATLWLDDIVVRDAHGDGARFASGPLDAQIAALPPARGLARLGTWGLPRLDPAALAQAKALGLGFGSNGDASLVQQRAFLNGIATNQCPGRPADELLLAGLGLTEADFDQDAQGRRTGEGVQSAIFHPAVVDRFCEYVADRVRSRKDAPWVSSFMLASPISRYGEVHYAASSGGQYAVFSRPAKENFRRWLQQAYGGDLKALAKAWGQPLAAWEDVVPPRGPQAGVAGLDTRTCWSDFMHWYNAWLEEVTRRSLASARAETDKPLAVMLGGPKVGPGQGISLGNIGPTARLLGQVRPAFFSDTDSQTLFSCKYTRAACSQYGVDLMVENVGPPYLEVFHQYNTVLNALACGADSVHLAHWGELYDTKTWFGRTWVGLAPLALRYRTGYERTDAAVFHSYMTSWYRPERANVDALRLYDSTNALWYPGMDYPSWGRVLGAPDVLDDAMLEDGALEGRKLLVIPNSSVTVTSRKAVDAIRAWVTAGGTVIGFGTGCLAYTVEADRSVVATPGLAGMVPATARAASADAAPDTSATAVVEANLGKGRAVLYLTPADPDKEKRFAVAALPLLAAAAERAGVRRWCRMDANDEANLVYCGKDRASGKHLFVADVTRSVRNGLPDAVFWTERTFTPSFAAELAGDAELVSITDAFENCVGGEAEFDAAAHTLVVRFHLPRPAAEPLRITFGKSRSGLVATGHPLLLWEGDELCLRPTGPYGVSQTQGTIRVGADGSLEPADVSMPYLVHGTMHREKFGRGPVFSLFLARAGSLTVRLNSVAAAGAVLVVSIDGKEAVRRELPDKDGENNARASECAADIVVPLSAGAHTVQVDNDGADWYAVDRYVFTGLK